MKKTLILILVILILVPICVKSWWWIPIDLVVIYVSYGIHVAIKNSTQYPDDY